MGHRTTDPSIGGEEYDFNCGRSAGILDAIEFDSIGPAFDLRG
jgi:hypothetical protein